MCEKNARWANNGSRRNSKKDGWTGAQPATYVKTYAQNVGTKSSSMLLQTKDGKKVDHHSILTHAGPGIRNQTPAIGTIVLQTSFAPYKFIHKKAMQGTRGRNARGFDLTYVGEPNFWLLLFASEKLAFGIGAAMRFLRLQSSWPGRRAAMSNYP